MSRELNICSLRDCLSGLEDEVKIIKEEVDPLLEAGAIHKAFEDGPVFLCEKLKEFPDARMVINLWNRRERVARLCGTSHYNQVKFKMLEAIRNPIPPSIVESAPCQEVFIPKEGIDPHRLFPMITYTEADGGRFFGNGVTHISGKYCNDKSQLSLYRMSFRGNDFASINMVPGGHGDQIAKRFYGEKIPITINICPPPMIELIGISTFFPVLFPSLDEVAVAGGLQGFPVEIVKAKSVDAYAIANAEWVIEGYIVPHERVWETEEAERLGKQGVAPFHPEWTRCMGTAFRARKFELTAVTTRKEKPIYFFPSGGEAFFPSLSACWYELAQRVSPGFVVDVNTSLALTTWGGVVFQVKKTKQSDEGLQKNLLAATLGLVRGLRLAIVVDEDVNIYDMDDIIWALTTRVEPSTDIVRGIGGRGQAYQSYDRFTVGAGEVARNTGGLGIDATVPFKAKTQFARAKFAVDKVDFKKWFTQKEIGSMRSQQREYYRWLGRMGFA